MQKFAIVGADGVPVQLGANAVAPEGAVAVPEFDDLAGYAAKWWDGAAWQARPELPCPEFDDAGLHWTGLPAGTLAVVEDGDTLQVLAEVPEEAGAITLTFGDSGRYLIEVTGPAPYLPWAVEFTC